MKLKGSIELFQYWDRLRSGRPAPKRTEIEPADIKSLLADTFILEKDARGEAVFRLAGTRLCATFGRELKGFTFSSLWLQKDERVVARLAHGAFLAKSVVVINFDGVSRNGRVNAFELLLLPLDGGVDHPRSLGAITPAERPYWLGADPVVECRITSLRVVDPEREPLFLANRPAVPVPSLSPSLDAADTAIRTGSGGRRIRHLLVLDGGRENH
ncbi:MAG: PAS domain-containing protein [Mesorhizobium sp.]|nr:PAS domain-containing protein [Mesorhizobium sp.]